MTNETYKQLKKKVQLFKELEDEKKKLEEIRLSAGKYPIDCLRAECRWNNTIPDKAQDSINSSIIEAIDKRIHLINLELEDL